MTLGTKLWTVADRHRSLCVACQRSDCLAPCCLDLDAVQISWTSENPKFETAGFAVDRKFDTSGAAKAKVEPAAVGKKAGAAVAVAACRSAGPAALFEVPHVSPEGVAIQVDVAKQSERAALAAGGNLEFAAAEVEAEAEAEAQTAAAAAAENE